MADQARRTVHSRIPKTDDIEIHISTLATEMGDYTDVREYVVSLDAYGRGITFAAGLNEEFKIAALRLPDEVE